MSRIAQRARQAVRHPFRAVQQPFRAARQAASAVSTSGHHLPERGIEVWQWTQPKYRVRAVVLLLINIALFVGLGCFTFWLRTGDYSPFTAHNYWQGWREAFSPTRVPPVTLIDFLTYPIPVDQAPLMLVIVGLVLASLTAIPILVSMLYGFRYALPFTIIICFVAVVPWLAITVTLCCFLARWRPLRFSFHYATALISLLPLVGYYALATGGPGASAEAGTLEMAKLYLPWVLALIGACVVMAIVLMTARLVNYRPGAIAPLMAVLFAVPVVMFETQVGRDELYYRLLEVEYGPRSTKHFVDYTDISRTLDRITARRLEAIRAEDPDADEATVREQVRLAMELQWARIEPELQLEDTLTEEQFTQDQWRAAARCDQFLRDYSQSRYVANVLYLKARALDMRIDRAYFRRTAILRHYWDFPSDASFAAWQRLLAHRDSPLSVVAAHRVALLQARHGDVDSAVDTLKGLLRREARSEGQAGGSAAAGSPSLFAKRPASRALDVEPAGVLLEARKLHDLIVHNRDPQYGDRPLVMLLRLNPRHPMYAANLRQMLAAIPNRYPLTLIGDNIEVLIASSRGGLSPSGRIERLKSCLERFARQPGGDAVPVAKLELGIALKDDGRFEEARAAFEGLSREAPDSPWASEARKQLAAMGVGRSGN